MAVTGARVARARPDGRLGRVDELAALGRVLLAEKHVERNSGEVGVGVEGLAVGEGELGALDGGVDVVGRIVAHGLEVEVLEQVELLQEDRPLAPRPALMDPVAAVARGDRFLDSPPVARKVLGGQEAPVRLPGGVEELVVRAPALNCLGDLPLVEDCAGRLQRLLTAPVGAARFGGEEPPHRVGPVEVVELVAHLGHTVAGEVDRRRGRPLLPVAILIPLDAAAQSRVHGETVLGQLDGIAEDIGQAHGPEALEGEYPRVHCPRNGRGQEAVAGDDVEAQATEVVEGRALRHPALTVDRMDVLGLGLMDENRHLAADAVLVRLEHRQAEGDGRRGVDGVAAMLQHAEAGRGRQVVLARDHAVGAMHNRPQRRRSVDVARVLGFLGHG